MKSTSETLEHNLHVRNRRPAVTVTSAPSPDNMSFHRIVSS